MADQYPPPPPPPGAYPPPPPPSSPPEPLAKQPHKLRTRGKVIAVVVGGLVLVAIIVAAVAGGGDDKPTTEAADTTETTATRQDTTPPAVEESTTTTQSKVAQIGPNEWFTWEDGVEAQVTAIERFTPDFDSTPGVPDVVATITVKNGTSIVLDVTGAQASLYAGPNGVQAEDEMSFYEVARLDDYRCSRCGTGFEPSVLLAGIPPGGTATAKWSWSVPPELLGELRVEFAPSTGRDPAFFRGSVT